MSPLASEQHYQRQAKLAALASTQAATAWTSGNLGGLTYTVAALQYTAASDADGYLDSFDQDAAGRIVPLAFAGRNGSGISLLDLFGLAETQALMQVVAASAVQDAGREAVGAGIAARPGITGYVRFLSPPSCARCTILAGRRYRWNAGFERHPRCDCMHVPNTINLADNAPVDPMRLLRNGQVKDLSRADTKAVLEGGADFSRVVNVRLPTAGGGRRRTAMPSDIYRAAGDDRAAAIRLLQRAGYITT